MPLLTPDQMSAPQFGSILLVSPSKRGKTMSICSLHRVLRLLKLPTEIHWFDFDEDGGDTAIRMAKEGRERYSDRPGTVPVWLDDLKMYRYFKAGRQIGNEGSGPLREPAPRRSKKPISDFMNDFNQLDSRLDPSTGMWKPGQEVGAIVLDSLTFLMHMYVDFVWLVRGKEIGAKGAAEAINWQDWDLVGQDIRDVYRTAKTFPCFVVATSHEDIRQELIKGSAKPAGPGQPAQPPAQVQGATWAVPMLTYGLSLSIAGDFGCCVHIDENRKFIGQPGGIIRSAGSRLKDLPKEPFEADFENLITIPK